MKRRAAILSTAAALTLIAALGAAVVFGGIVDVSVTEPEPKIVQWVLSTTMKNSVERHARDIVVPAELDLRDPELAQRAFGHYSVACTRCHGGPGVAAAPWLVLDPPARSLAETADEWSDRELYWIVKHGIQMTGMPALGPTHGDADLWAIAAFVRQLPDLTPEQYQAMATRHDAGHGGHGMSPPAPAAPVTRRSHPNHRLRARRLPRRSLRARRLSRRSLRAPPSPLRRRRRNDPDGCPRRRHRRRSSPRSSRPSRGLHRSRPRTDTDVITDSFDSSGRGARVHSPALVACAVAPVRGAAGAVEATVLRTGAARAHHLLAQGLSRAEDPYARVVRRDPDLRRIVFHGHAVDLDALQRVRVLRLEIHREPGDAAADDVVDVGCGLVEPLKLARERVEPSVGHPPAALVVDHRVAQHTEKPRPQGLLFSDLPAALDAAHEGLLEDVLGDRAAANALLDEGEKHSVVRDELGRDR